MFFAEEHDLPSACSRGVVGTLYGCMFAREITPFHGYSLGRRAGILRFIHTRSRGSRSIEVQTSRFKVKSTFYIPCRDINAGSPLNDRNLT